MSCGATTRTMRRGLRIAAALTGLALAIGAWWVWSQRPAPADSPLPPEPSSSDPDVTAGFAALRQRVLREPQSAAAWGAYGEVLLANGCNAAGGVCLAQAEKLEPAEPRWPYLRGWALFSTDRRASLQATLRAAALLDQAGDAAIVPWLQLATFYLEIDDREQVEAWCRRILEREPENGGAHFDLGMIAILNGDVDVGIAHLLRAANSPTVRQRAYLQLAAAYNRQENKAEASKYERLAQDAAPDEPLYDPYVSPLEGFKLGAETRFRVVKALGSQGRLTDQAALLRRMVDENHDERANLDLGIVLTELGAFDEAEPILLRAVNHYGAAGDPLYFLGVERYKKGETLEQRDKKQAADLFQASADATRRATASKADHAMAHYFHGLALIKLGRSAEALDSLRTAARCRPEMFDIQLALGKALAQAGQQAEAEAHLQEACQLAPDDAGARNALAQVRATLRKE